MVEETEPESASVPRVTDRAGIFDEVAYFAAYSACSVFSQLFTAVLYRFTIGVRGSSAAYLEYTAPVIMSGNAMTAHAIAMYKGNLPPSSCLNIIAVGGRKASRARNESKRSPGGSSEGDAAGCECRCRRDDSVLTGGKTNNEDLTDTDDAVWSDFFQFEKNQDLQTLDRRKRSTFVWPLSPPKWPLRVAPLLK